jgi:hypothetical protein
MHSRARLLVFPTWIETTKTRGDAQNIARPLAPLRKPDGPPAVTRGHPVWRARVRGSRTPRASL